MTLVRFDVEPGESTPGFDRTLLQTCRYAVRSAWKPLWDARELIGNDVDRDWRWNCQVFHPRVTYPGSGGYVRGSLLLIVSGRNGGRLEALARIAHGYETNFLKKVPGRKGRPLLRPRACYLDTLATAPWNRAELRDNPEPVRDLGRLLLQLAAIRSQVEGQGGRIALEPAPGLESYYRKRLPGIMFGTLEDRNVMEVDMDGIEALKASCPPDWRLAEKLLSTNRWAL